MSLRLSLVALAAITCASVSAAPASRIEKLAWLSGCWQLDDQPPGAGEQWSTLAGGTMLASSRGLRDGKTDIFEFLVLRQHDDGRLVLTAIPFGRNATDFPATQVDEASAVFENAENDFPQRISYRRVDDQRLQARIEIAQDDPKQAMDFPMHRVACGGPVIAGAGA